MLTIYVLWLFLHSEKIPKTTIVAFTGAPGTGKTLLSITNAFKAYKLQRLKHTLRFIPLFRYFCPECVHKATLWANNPIRISRKKWCNVLDVEHILCTKLLPERAVVYIGEFGSTASQWEFDNPLVMENLTSFVRFYRHFLDGRLFVDDQTSDSIVKPVRSRLGIIYYLYDFRRLFFVLPFAKISCIPLLAVEDNNTQLTDDFDRYFMAFLPYKWMFSLGICRKKYDSRCYSDLYFKNAVPKVEKYETYKTEYLIDVAVSDVVRKEYKMNRPNNADGHNADGHNADGHNADGHNAGISTTSKISLPPTARKGRKAGGR